MFFNQIKKHIDKVEGTLDSAFELRLLSDVNALGGALLEQDLTRALTDDKFVCLTNRMVESMVSNGVKFNFPHGQTFEEVLKLTKEMGNEFYATDLFLFKRNKASYTYVDSISLKTSFSTSGGVMVNLVNDADGQALEALESGQDIYLGQTLLILVNMETGDYEIVWVDGSLRELVGGHRHNIKDDGSWIYKTCDFKWGAGKNKIAVVVTNRNKRANKTNASSFNRGVKIRKDVIHNFGHVLSLGQISVDSIRADIVRGLVAR